MKIEELLKEKILILDGAMGTMVQSLNLPEEEFRRNYFDNSLIQLKGNNDLLSLTRPDIILGIHRAYVQAGANIIKTNTFGSNSISLSKYNLQSYVQLLNKQSVKLAQRAVGLYSSPSNPCYIAGVIGPTSKLASIPTDVNNPANRDITFDFLLSCYSEQAEVLIESGVHVILIETIFDTLNAKAAIHAVRRISKDIPIMISASLSDKSGRTLSGQTLKAFYHSVEFANPLSIGLNCSLGVEGLVPHIIELANYSKYYVSLHANAGLPDINGKYKQSPEEFANRNLILALTNNLNIVGGCCGTTPQHIKALAEVIRNVKPRELPKLDRQSYAGLEPFVYDNYNKELIIVGERTSVMGSKKFADLIRSNNYEEAVEIARSQVEAGADIIDINMDADLIDAKESMVKFLNYIQLEPDIARVPMMIDSSNFAVIEAGLKTVQGKSIVNSLTLKEGDEYFLLEAKKVKSLGASVIVMACDEKGQADTVARRVEIVDRAYDLLVNNLGFNPEDIIFDLNIFPIGTGIKDHDNYAVDFIEATKIVKQKYPQVTISGGISNLSYSFRGLSQVRKVIHSIFLHYAIQAGLSMAIVNPASLIEYEKIPEPLKSLVEDLVLNRNSMASENLINHVQQEQYVLNIPVTVDTWNSYPISERLQKALILGTDKHLEKDLHEALLTYTPIEIIESLLLEGMTEVGVLFNQGKMFLPQVVKSSKIMKEAVDLLNPLLGTKSKSFGTIVLATVKGDVHDIGKNILASILRCNGFNVIDLGVMVDEVSIFKAAMMYSPDILGLSGLITPSLDEMINVARSLSSKNIKLPVLMVGGATTSNLHTALKIAPQYSGLVVHTTNASEAVVAAKKLVSKDEEYIKHIQEEYEDLVNEYEESLR